MKLAHFRVNYYATWKNGFPVGPAIDSHEFEVPAASVAIEGPTMLHDSCLTKAAQWARNLGYEGQFGIQEIGRETIQQFSTTPIPQP